MGNRAQGATWEQGGDGMFDGTTRVSRWIARMDSVAGTMGWAWATIALVALGSRWLGLGQRPLDASEGHLAMQAWDWNHGLARDFQSGPVLVNLLSLVFVLFTSSDMAARSVSALAGAALALGPYLLRRQMGNGPALAAGLGLALSPTLLFASRYTGSAIPLALAVFSVFVLASNLQSAHKPTWLAAAGTTAAFGLGVDRTFVLFLLPLVTAGLVPRGLGTASGRTPAGEGPAERRRRALALMGTMVVAVVVLDTAFLTRLSGIQAGLVDPAVGWLADIRGEHGLWRAPLLLVLYELPLLVAAAGGTAAAAQRGEVWQARVVVWAVGTLVLAVLGPPQDLRFQVQMVVPLCLLAGPGLWGAVRLLARADMARPLVASAVISVPVVSALLVVNRSLALGQPVSISSLLLASAGLSGAILIVMAWPTRAAVAGALDDLTSLQNGWRLGEWLDRDQALATVLVISGSVLVLLWGSAAFRLNYPTGTPRQELLVGQAARLGVREVEEVVSVWSRQDWEGPVSVDPALRPALAWSLRGVGGVVYQDPAAASGRAVLGVEKANSVAGAVRRRTRLWEGQRLASPPSVGALARWVVHGTPLVPSEPRDVILVR